MNIETILNPIQFSEAKQVGIIYHSTSHHLNTILTSGKLKSVYGFVSFTRDFNLNFGAIRIAFDGNKLSEKYHIEPFQDIEGGIERKNSSEAEERIILKNSLGIDIVNRKYVIQIDILDNYIENYLYGSYWEDILKNSEKKFGFPINSVTKWMPVKL